MILGVGSLEQDEIACARDRADVRRSVPDATESAQRPVPARLASGEDAGRPRSDKYHHVRKFLGKRCDLRVLVSLLGSNVRNLADDDYFPLGTRGLHEVEARIDCPQRRLEVVADEGHAVGRGHRLHAAVEGRDAGDAVGALGERQAGGQAAAHGSEYRRDPMRPAELGGETHALGAAHESQLKPIGPRRADVFGAQFGVG